MAARANGMPVEIEIVDLSKNEHMNDNFLKINSQYCILSLEEDGFVLRDSHAIACYLADKYGKDDQWYPKDLKQRALASRVLGQYLVFDKDETKFKEWLKEQSGGTAKHCTDCYNGLKDWDDRFL
ncbi:Unclassified glutathione S-transferase [Operophtera brumata]|uniref:Unclassified glutathione S-transferase n=1 Tax=Operophtera brumata TaxID=104452 RepID=A0A0L7KPG5_OPEBR|nr:Unclassified glutathione S-transferase [Operophtera brumata]